MLFDPTGPLVIRWRHLPSMLPFLLRFAQSARHVEAISGVLAAALRSAGESYDTILQDAGLAHLVRRSGELYVYENELAYLSAIQTHAIRERRGVSVTHLSGDEAREIEPALGRSVTRAVLLPDTLAAVDPYLLTRGLAEHFRATGGTVLEQEVTDVRTDDAKGVDLITRGGTIRADGAVLAAGAESHMLARRLGLSVPLQAERGYHLMIEGASPLRTPIVSGELRFGIVPLLTGTRIVGSSELASLTHRADFSRVRRLLAPARRLVPSLADGPLRTWMGARPSMPDSLPVIMRSPRSDRVLFAFGHGHLGLTLAAFTGRLVRDLAIANAPQPECFAWPRRFKRHASQPSDTARTRSISTR